MLFQPRPRGAFLAEVDHCMRFGFRQRQTMCHVCSLVSQSDKTQLKYNSDELDVLVERD